MFPGIGYRTSRTSFLLTLPTTLLLVLLVVSSAHTTEVNALGWGGVQQAPSESECRPYIEKALKEQHTSTEAVDTPLLEIESTEEISTETSTDANTEQEGSAEAENEKSVETHSAEKEVEGSETGNVEEQSEGNTAEESEVDNTGEAPSDEASAEMLGDQPPEEEKEEEEVTEENKDDGSGIEEVASEEDGAAQPPAEASGEVSDEKTADQSQEANADEGAVDAEPTEENTAEETESTETVEADGEQESEQVQSAEENETENAEGESVEEAVDEGSGEPDKEITGSEEVTEEAPKEEPEEDKTESEEESTEVGGVEIVESEETATEESTEETTTETEPTVESSESKVEETEETVEEEKEVVKSEETTVEETKSVESGEEKAESVEEVTEEEVSKETVNETIAAIEETVVESEPAVTLESEEVKKEETAETITKEAEKEEEEEYVENTPEEDLTLDVVIPEKLRPREHITEILRLGSEAAETENLLSKTIDITLRELKRLYDNAIKPLEILYKYRDLSNRHFGDPEIFSKPLILFMGPWSGGKSSIINYLLDNEYKKTALRTGAEPSPAYFNILMWGNESEVLDGTQLAADWTFSGLQKFGQGLLDRLRGLRLDNPLLEKVNIVEIPGILEIRKQVERMFPFNDACQWFIDRADIIFLVYDPSKLDVGPETEAILDQLKGREYQTRIILNKADQVKPEELMRVQGTLIWNISPLMSSSEPPVMYSTSLWSLPYESGAPGRLLYAQERAFLRDLREAVDKRVENKIASARRFAVRVRNHAKMVDCYLTTFYNHKTFFGNKKRVAEDIIEHPQNYHIYEGLSTLTNISRYDLPDPEVYRDFFRLNPIYEFQQLSATCTYFRGCPINRLDIAIAYDLPELVGKYKKSAEHTLANAQSRSKS